MTKNKILKSKCHKQITVKTLPPQNTFRIHFLKSNTFPKSNTAFKFRFQNQSQNQKWRKSGFQKSHDQITVKTFIRMPFSNQNTFLKSDPACKFRFQNQSQNQTQSQSIFISTSEEKPDF